jgi:hypothetical protein
MVGWILIYHHGTSDEIKLKGSLKILKGMNFIMWVV